MSNSQKPLPEQLDTVAELTARLADQAMAEMMSQRAVSDRTVRSLADGVLLLDQHAHPIPRLALDLLMRIHGERFAEGAAAADDPVPEAGGHEPRRDGELGPGRKVLKLFRSFRAKGRP
ncbi:hypothetical protein J2X36_002815 [Methylobacterium sp. BE186]|uniref:hypothetical protein n=1 Tax=Methylobacterium sp. BE186 TaxID=2817715 RepID=UPI002860F42E|nr:hypothetical protein [Methylobacterium sp. BE186]MDR7038060.1 hypothetical protein [Methylobacterium sp. BE186]